MLNYVTVEHVHAGVIAEFKLELERFAGIKVPRLLHRFVGVTGHSVATQALLRNIMNVHSVGLVCWICKDPFLSGPKDRPGVDSVRIES